MVKLFVGNLAEGVDSHRLRNLFLQHVNVQECDVLKNFAFVHVATEEDADLAIRELDKTQLEGREIHIERSTSRLRKEPGMGDKCFTCGASDHKTPQCPQEQGRRKKRPNETDDFPNKKPNNGIITVPTPQAQPTPQCWGYKLGGGTDDSELPAPNNPELRPLYEQYMESRARYHYFREKLSKELSLQPGGIQASAPPAPVNIGRFDLTRTTQSQTTPTPSVQTKYPGAAPTGTPYGYQPTASYPGAKPTAAPYSGVQATGSPYPGAQSTVAPYPGAQSNVSPYPGVQSSVAPYPGVNVSQPSYGYTSQATSQYSTTPSYSSVSSYATPPSYKGSYATPNYAK